MSNAIVRAAIDIGGTFTDLASYDGATRSVRFEKALSTPDSLGDAVLECFAKGEVDIARMEHFIHGSTVAINAVIQKTGGRTALVTTEGFVDLYEIGRTNRPDTYNLFFEKPVPLVPATLRFAVKERMTAEGKVHAPLTATSLNAVVRALRVAKVEAVAVCLLHAYANPAHEIAVGKRLRKEFPKLFVTLSHEILREYREYERTSTAVLNAYVGTQVSTYLRALEQPLKERAFKGKFLIMQSNGGVMTAKRATTVPVAMMESGPAGGIIGAAELGQLIGEPDVIAFDMGGTTAKTCLVEEGLPKMTDQYFIGG
ncbi:MAG: hydantoinase/oxoprolinase family protein, partial [Burkholderiales bacterium]